ncbi:MAG: hypothetical protein NTW87_14785 [Planctomycetota bacterium]|nr:hypothetical protein [Planctomycetota bacterium]
MLQRITACAVLAGMSLLLAGCIQSKTVVTVEKDGSGTIEQTAYWAKMQMEGMPGGLKAGGNLDEQCAKTAKALGEGVTVKSAAPLTDRKDWEGAKVVYAFNDISKVRINTVPPVGNLKAESKDISFEFAKAPTPKLTVTMPPMESPVPDQPKEAAQGPEADKMAEAMMSMMLKDLLIDFQVKVNGVITQTNAAYPNAQKNGLTLVHEDFGGLMGDEAGAKKFKLLKDAKDPKAMKAALADKDIAKFIQMDPSEKVTIEFK